MFKPEMLELLCCPESGQALAVADELLLERINRQIAGAAIRNRAGQPVAAPLESGLIRSDGRFLYPVRNRTPVLLAEEAIPLPQPK